MADKKISRRTSRHLLTELREIDYLRDLDSEELEFLTQFYYEYYQGDFNFKSPIHKTKEHIKDCRDRNNAARRQWHSVGSDIKATSIRKALSKNEKRPSSQYYTPADYHKELIYVKLVAPDDTSISSEEGEESSEFE